MKIKDAKQEAYEFTGKEVKYGRSVALLSKDGIKGGSARKHHWTDEERDIVRRDYNGHNASAHSIAARMGVTFCAVKGKVQELGIALDKSPRWTPAEEADLREWITQYAPPTVAEKLGRSINSVVVKSRRLGLSRRIRDGWFTKREVAEICGVDHKKVGQWIDTGALKASWHTDIKPCKEGSACWHICEEDLRAFIIAHSYELIGRNVDLFTIVNILIAERA